MKEGTERAERFLNYEKLGDELTNAGRNAWFAGLGAIATMENEAVSFFDKLVERGKNFDKREKSFLSEAAENVMGVGKKIETGLEKRVVATLHRVGVPSNKEIHTLITRVEELTQKVQTMRHAK